MGSLQPIFIDTSYHELPGSFLLCALPPLLLAPLWCPNLQTGNLGSAVEMLLQKQQPQLRQQQPLLQQQRLQQQQQPPPQQQQQPGQQQQLQQLVLQPAVFA